MYAWTSASKSGEWHRHSSRVSDSNDRLRDESADERADDLVRVAERHAAGTR
jgi:hypothetical protein